MPAYCNLCMYLKEMELIKKKLYILTENEHVKMFS